jgi:hypothetical protein
MQDTWIASIMASPGDDQYFALLQVKACLYPGALGEKTGTAEKLIFIESYEFFCFCLSIGANIRH